MIKHWRNINGALIIRLIRIYCLAFSIGVLCINNIFASNQTPDSSFICGHIDTSVKRAVKLYDEGKLDSAFILAEIILNKCDALSITQQGKLNILCGNIKEDMGDYAKGFYFYDRAFSNYIAANNLNGLAIAINNIGNMYYRWSYFEKAVIYHKQALSIHVYNHDNKGIASSYNNLGNIYFSWNKYDKALAQYKKALALKSASKDSSELANIQINAGSAYLSLNNLSEAEKCYNSAFAIAKKQNNVVLQTDCQINIGYIRFLQKKYYEAIVLYRKAFQTSKEKGFVLEELMASKNLSEVYYATDSILLGNKFMNDSWLLAQTNHLTEVTLDLMDIKMTRLEKEGKIAEAYQMLKESKILNDSIFNESSMTQLIDLQSIEKAEKQLREIQIKNLQISLRENELWNLRQLLLLISGLLLTGVAVILIIFKYREKKSQLNHEKQLRTSMQKSLAAQMNPHFISNSLNSIQKFFLENDIDSASSYLNNFGSLIRTVLDSSMHEYISIEEEIQILRLYTELESLRLNRPIELIVNWNENLGIEKCKIPPLILQPIIENAIWHGLAHIEKSGIIQIDFNFEGHFIKCTICDNGRGLSHSKKINAFRKLSGRKSYGLQLVKDRLRMMKNDRKDFVSVIIEDILDSDVSTGTRVILFIPKL